MTPHPHIARTFVLQQDQQDCGVACLLSLVRYYGGDDSLENLRRLSGTDTQGTTLLGLWQAAGHISFAAQGCEADPDALLAYDKPVILHVYPDKNLSHFVVCYGACVRNGKTMFIIGDPGSGIRYLTREELERIWISRTCLTLSVKPGFRLATEIRGTKRKWLIRLLKQDTVLLAITVFLGLAIAAMGLAVPLFSQKLIDDILPGKKIAKLGLGIGLLVFLLLTKELLSIVRQSFLLGQSRDFNIRIIDHFYNHLLRLPQVFFDTRTTGDMTARLNDTIRIQKVISQLAGTVVVDLLTMLTTLGILFTYSWRIALPAALCLPLYFYLVYSFRHKLLDGQRAVMTSYAASESNYISTIQGIGPIRNHNKQDMFSLSNASIYRVYQDRIVNLGKLQIRLGFIANAINALFLGGILVLVALLAIHGSLRTGELIAVLGLSSALLPAVANLALVSIPLAEARIAFDRMFEFTNSPAEGASADGCPPFESLRVRHLSFRFPGRRLLLQNIGFEILRGEIIAIMGENGGGKSTLAQLLAKNYTPESGEIIINKDLSLTDLPADAWRQQIATIPQQAHIFNGTVLENIAFEDATAKTEEVIGFIQQLGLDSFIRSLPQSYATQVGETGVKLSGGQKQLIALARALYHRPRLLVMDEATSAMDRNTEKQVLHMLQKMRHHMAIIFITHRLHVLRSFCDRIYILENGTFTAAGNHGELLGSPNLYSLYWADIQ